MPAAEPKTPSADVRYVGQFQQALNVHLHKSRAAPGKITSTLMARSEVRRVVNRFETELARYLRCAARVGYY